MDFSETAWQIKAKLHVEPSREGGKNFHINGTGSMTKMTDLPLYGDRIALIW